MGRFHLILLITLFQAIPSFSGAAPVGHCVLDKQYQSNPMMRPENNIEAHNMLEQITKDFSSKNFIMSPEAIKMNRAANGGNIIIPVVFHVMKAFPEGDENISFEQIEEALVQVNEDFNLQNARRSGNIHSNFSGIEANVGVRFELAQRDPDGYPTNGVTRTTSVFTHNGGQIEVKETIQWPRDRYLNIWVVSSSDGNNGSAFAFLPASVEDLPIYDGIITSHWAVGRTGTAASTHLGNLTHEIGHWANLGHVWGGGEFGVAGNCQTDDEVNDTPNTIGNSDNNACGSLIESCGTQDNISNFMDYACEVMYTDDQRSRMLATLSSPISGRNNTWTVENQISTGVLDTAVYALFSADKGWVVPGQQVIYTDESELIQGGAITDWQWSFPGGNPSTFDGQNPPAITYNSPGMYPVSLTVSNDQGSNTRTRAQQIDVNNNVIMNKTGTVTVNSDAGWFYDSGFTNNYDIDESGVLTLQPATSGHVIEVDFYDYNMEPQEEDGSCLWDFLEVFDGTTTASPLIGKYCGKFPAPSLRATNMDGALTFRFTSDDNTFINGWKAKFTAVDANINSTDIIMGSLNNTDTCGVKFYDSGKHMSYNNDENLTITLNPEITNDAITVNFTEFSIEDDGCQWDYLEIFDGISAAAPQLGGKYCGNTSPGSFTATNPEGALTFKFISDGNTVMSGWQADVTCGFDSDLIFINGFESN